MHPFTLKSILRWERQVKYLRQGGNRSIHPRVINGKTIYPKVNTAKPRRSSQAAMEG